MYSRGDDIISIRECFTELLEGEIFVSNLHNRYVDFLWLFSIGILLEMDDVLLKRLIYLVERDNLNDRLIDFLIEFRYSEWNGKSTSFLHDNPYKAFDQIINTNKLAATERLKQYLEKEWYKGHNDIGWYESHKSKENIYSGYWSFESAAIVKIMELDDSSFKDNIYYPYDLVHWK